jgi:pantoate--beta-alanine ligase
MQLIHSVEEMKVFSRRLRREGKTLGLVPTMGALHEGHLSLLRRAQQQCDAAVVSIFVNPTQFGPSEDFARYPRNLEKDLEALRMFNVDACFAPAVEEIYAAGFSNAVDPGDMASRLEGASRPGHFKGVATVVLQLFSIVTPDLAYFGQKDFQQGLIVRRMIRDFHLDARVVVCPIVRDKDGIALSSRNEYLSSAERETARLLSRSLKRAQEVVWRGETRARHVCEEMRRILDSDSRLQTDYAVVVNPENLQEVKDILSGNVALVAARVGAVRLIDNTILGAEGASEDELLNLALSAAAQVGLAVRPPGLDAERLRREVHACRDCAAISSVVLPPREFLAKYLHTDYPDLGAVHTLVVGRDAPWNPEHYIYRSPESQYEFVSLLLEMLGVKSFGEFKAEFALTDALRCHSVISPLPERALSNCARHLREELRMFPRLQAVILLGEDAYLQFQRFVLDRSPEAIRPWSTWLGERGWGEEAVTVTGLAADPLRVLYCHHPATGRRISSPFALQAV